MSNLTKERVDALNRETRLSPASEYVLVHDDFALVILDLIAFWREKQPRETRNWRTKPISRTCEFNLDGMCGKLTTYAYRAHKAGWMALCEEHGHQHLPYCDSIDELITAGESFEPYEEAP